jgi:tetratricopeptide (TPR) repeat protein
MLLLAHEYNDQAATCFAQAEGLDSRQADWPCYQGIALAATQPEEAVKKLQRATELKGGEADVLRLRLADALVGLDRLEEAESQFSQVARTDSANVRAQLGLGRVALRRGQAKESVPYLEKARQDPRTRKAALGLLARARQMLGEGDAAVRLQREASAAPDDQPWLDPWWQRVLDLRIGKNADIARARQLFRANRVQEGIALVEQTVRTYPDEPYLWFMLGKARYQTKELALAEKALRKSLELEPKSVQTVFLLGVVVGERGNLREARELFRTSTTLRSDFALGHYNFGLCLVKEGNRKGAIEAFRLAAKADPGFGKAHEGLAELLAKEGRTADALVHAQEAVRLQPQDAEAKKLLEDLQKRQSARGGS